ncbi:arabinose efflux permease family protein [Desulfosporosinus orientis DSM 765]|uniref:Arabinose efflux permease family protein n=1 Tax=Desulfosporosinus orientis (strain ATCC 19365 / DSM 765 / NCIMB 8382 / VKM B-1628 / Singapore I) TaxID=768706 RepID=G7W6M5_DESOD|nr:MFS transporter [Desulfosporosinus orientis]AET68663.1 arabinose efflux permease family protein [Desulfosporosinus orientis DSM 765]
MNLNKDSNLTWEKKQNRKKIGFIGAACSLAVVYAASSAPIPLYNSYRQTIGLTNGDLAMTSVAYFVGTVITLLMFARLSNYLGRRPVVLVTLGLAMIGCLMFFYIHNAPMFLIGRLIQGFSCGLASSTVTTYIIDNAPESPGWIGAAVTSAAPMIGLAVGAFGSGALKQYGSGSLSLIFGILIVALAGCVVLITLSPETVTRKRGAVASIVPQIRLPQNIRSLLPAASATFVGTWAIGGFYQAFSAPMAAEQLGTTNTMIAAAVFAGMMAPNVIGGSLAGRMKTTIAQRMGMSVFFLSLLVIIASLRAGAVVPFLVAGIFAGAAWGAAFTGSLRGILNKTSQEDRAGVLSTVYLISYSGAAIPNLIVGRLPKTINLFEIALGYGLLVAVASIITLVTARQGTEGQCNR